MTREQARERLDVLGLVPGLPPAATPAGESWGRVGNFLPAVSEDEWTTLDLWRTDPAGYARVQAWRVMVNTADRFTKAKTGRELNTMISPSSVPALAPHAATYPNADMIVGLMWALRLLENADG